jgi:alpha-tubulin suppressor-like RCC1 family protein
MEGEVFTWGIYKYKSGEYCGFRSNRGKTEFQDEPEELPWDEPFVQIGSTQNKTLGLTDSGNIYEWGDTGLSKRTVSRHTKDCLEPQFVNIPKKVCKFFCSSSGDHVFAVAPDEHVYAWGYDKFHQLGLYSSAYEAEKEKLKKEREVDRKKKLEEQGKTEEPKKKKKGEAN